MSAIESNYSSTESSVELSLVSSPLYEELVDLLPIEAKEYLYLHSDGRLFISQSYRFNPFVTGYIGKLKRLGCSFQPQYVELAVISQFRELEDSQEKTLAASSMQRYAKTLFEKAVELRASDIHIRCSKVGNTSIHMRVNGDIEFIEEHTYIFGTQLCTTIYQAMADVSDSSFEPLSRQDARIGDRSKIPMGIDGIRIATAPQVDGYVMVLRLLYNDNGDNHDLELLGYSKVQANAFETMKANPIGINIIAGPTGSGKSTSLQRVLSSIIQETGGRKNVITVEDPPEYPIPGAVQTPVTNADSEEERERAFHGAIKSAMRLDPDIIMIGEIRDGPSATLALRAAMTGHQVWSTLHANGAFSILDRLLDLGVPLELLSDHKIVTGLSCQRLVKTLCGFCKIPLFSVSDRYTSAQLKRIEVIGDFEQIFVSGKGCDHCRNSGYSGRTVLAEAVITDATLMGHIRTRDRFKAEEHWRLQQNGMTMLDHAIAKIRAGQVDPFSAEEIVGPLAVV